MTALRRRLSRLIPLRMRSEYRVLVPEGMVVMDGTGLRRWTAGQLAPTRSTWWQWRGRVFRHRPGLSTPPPTF